MTGCLSAPGLVVPLRREGEALGTSLTRAPQARLEMHTPQVRALLRGERPCALGGGRWLRGETPSYLQMSWKSESRPELSVCHSKSQSGHQKMVQPECQRKVKPKVTFQAFSLIPFPLNEILHGT